MWNKITDVLPSEGCYLTVNSGRVVVANFDGKGMWQVFIPNVALFFQPLLENVTHYAPLPAPPNSDNSESETHPPTGAVQNG